MEQKTRLVSKNEMIIHFVCFVMKAAIQLEKYPLASKELNQELSAFYLNFN